MLAKRINNQFVQNILLNYIFKFLTLGLGLFSTKLIFGYLGATLYGLWVTITSVVSWMNSGDLGIGNGLRNELAKAFAKNDIKLQEELINSAFQSMTKVSILLFVLFILVLESFLKFELLPDDIRVPLYITSLFFCLNLVLGIFQSVAYGYQKSWLCSLSYCEFQLLIVISTSVLICLYKEPNLKVFALVHGICSSIPNIVLFCLLKTNGLVLFSFHKKNRKLDITPIMSKGIFFFGIQICGIILYSTDNIIINKLIGSEMVSKYELISKIFNTFHNYFSVLLIALWSAVAYHIAKNDIMWIKKKIRELVMIWGIFSIGVFVVSLFFNELMRIWLGPSAFYYETPFILLFFAYFVTTSFSAIFVNVLNGMGAVKIQFFLALFSAAINIPLSIFFAQNCGMGILGIKLATFLSVLLSAIIYPIQVYFEIRSKLCNEL